MEINQPIIDAVRDRLDRDPRLPRADEIAVTAHGNEVTLRGTVGSFAEVNAAVSDARGIVGVVAVVEELHVRLLDADRREDAEIRGAALQRLVRDSSIPGDDLEVRVRSGWVTLTGDVDRQVQSDIAFGHVAGLRGVTGVSNEIRVGRARRTHERLTEIVAPPHSTRRSRR
jgi:osmotically-inducible protein OsmY